MNNYFKICTVMYLMLQFLDVLCIKAESPTELYKNGSLAHQKLPPENEQEINSEDPRVIIIKYIFLYRLTTITIPPVLSIVRIHLNEAGNFYPHLLIVMVGYLATFHYIIDNYVSILLNLFHRNTVFVFIITNIILSYPDPKDIPERFTTGQIGSIRPPGMPVQDFTKIIFGIFRLSFIKMYYISVMRVIDMDYYIVLASASYTASYLYSYWNYFSTD